MALDNKDEDYLEQLLNSVVEGSETDSDDWFEKELEDGDFNFDEEISDINDDIDFSNEDEQKELTGEEAEESFSGDDILAEEPPASEKSLAEETLTEEPFIEESFMESSITEELSTDELQLDTFPEEESGQTDISGEIDTEESDDDLADILSMITDQQEKQIAAEIIREKLLWLLDKEVPHGIAIEIEKMEEKKTITNIAASIYCEKGSHKGIIIGKNGEMLKKIGSMARTDIEKMLDKKVFLQLWVKVKTDWRNNAGLIKSFGYER